MCYRKDSFLLVLCLAFVALAQNCTQETRKVDVTGTGTASAAADTASISLGVKTTAETASAAWNITSTSMNVRIG